MKNRAVIEVLQRKYNRTSRFYGGSPKHNITIRVYLDEFPRSLKMTLGELGDTFLEIEKEHKGKIGVLPLNENSTRVKRDFYPVRINPKTFPRVGRSAKKPSVSEHDGFWCLSLPGQKQLIRAGRQGSFNGELFAILAERWGSFQSVEYVLGELNRRVKDMRTQGKQSPEQIKEHLKEINETLYKGCERRLKRIGDWPNIIGVIWGHTLWNAILRISRGVPTVGFARVAKPTRTKKITSK